MHREPDCAALIGHTAGDGLPNPPGGIGGELESLGVVELLHCPDQAQIALLDQVQQRHTAAGVTLGEGYHEPEVGFEQMRACGLAFTNDGGQIALAAGRQSLAGFQQMLRIEARLDALGQLDLVGCREQCRTADPIQVHTYQIGGRALGVEVRIAGAHTSGGGACHDLPPVGGVSLRTTDPTGRKFPATASINRSELRFPSLASEKFLRTPTLSERPVCEGSGGLRAIATPLHGPHQTVTNQSSHHG